MRPSLSLALLVASAVALGNVTAAADPPNKKEIKRDPENKRGISPFMEAIVKGQAAFVARDMNGALSAFQEAVKLDTEQMLGFYRLGEVQLEMGKLDDADATWQAALSKRGNDDLRAKVLFVIADLRERQKKHQAAKDAWAAYSAFLQNNVKARGYPASAIERQKVIDRRMKDEIDYGAVKQRIAKRQAEKEAEALENAKKDKLNR